MVGALLADRLFHALLRGSIYHEVDVWHLLLDGAMLAGIIALALSANRKWPMWLAALQVIATMSHALRAIDTEMLNIVYPVLSRAPFYPQLGVLIIACLLANRTRRARGVSDTL